MKKNWIPTTALIVIAVITATVFAEEAAKPQPAKRPQRPSVRAPRNRGVRPQRPRGMEAMIMQQTKRMETEITRIKTAHEAATKELTTIMEQAKAEKATKTAAMLSKLIEKKNAANTEKINQIKKRAEDFKKRMQRGPRNRNSSGVNPASKSAREKMPPRKPRTSSTTSSKPSTR